MISVSRLLCLQQLAAIVYCCCAFPLPVSSWGGGDPIRTMHSRASSITCRSNGMRLPNHPNQKLSIGAFCWRRHYQPMVPSRSTTSSTRSTSSLSLTSDNDSQKVPDDDAAAANASPSPALIFSEFSDFLQSKQQEIIRTLEEMDGSDARFTKDGWGAFSTDSSTRTNNDDDDANKDATTGTPKNKSNDSGGITRVIQGGDVIEKGACSFTLIQQGVLTTERASAIQSRQQNGKFKVQAGDTYSAAALSIVLHSRSPLVPTFRSDVRIFLVQQSSEETMAWFGGGADLTPYYLVGDDIAEFHAIYKDLCDNININTNNDDDKDNAFSYATMKKACDDYFYLPARSEHRGTGGIFFDDMTATKDSMEFVKGVSNMWTPSWLPIVNRHRDEVYSEKQREWQLLRRGRYLEFNLLYDRGVKFGLANTNPRVEGVMVSAPPLIAWEYNHVIEKGSPEAAMMAVLKTPRDWV